MFQLTPQQYFELLRISAHYREIMQFWQPLLLIFGFVSFFVCVAWVAIAVRWIKRVAHAESCNRFLMNMLVHEYGVNREWLENKCNLTLDDSESVSILPTHLKGEEI